MDWLVNTMAATSTTRKCLKVKSGRKKKIESENATRILNDDQSGVSDGEVGYSFMDSPHTCNHNERLDSRGICRVVF
ncbi:hypothetical protein Bhyg_14734 [Pseudolycoriella hygida]|uniref:Uncharacterized protein n=1 Tax=Pseudolycoriella hygida TaxID=35572 RepID=A0A9Q0RXG5_9DIPT|nr:hypothetical protein Bhyg_14734 [Pseudolycoriella hygida]